MRTENAVQTTWFFCRGRSTFVQRVLCKMCKHCQNIAKITTSNTFKQYLQVQAFDMNINSLITIKECSLNNLVLLFEADLRSYSACCAKCANTVRISQKITIANTFKQYLQVQTFDIDINSLITIKEYSLRNPKSNAFIRR